MSGFSTLLTTEGWELVNSLPPYDKDQVFSLTERLRREGFEPAMISAALTQSRLRSKAEDKFGPFAGRMLLTSEGLEQATRLSVGAFHAQRLRDAGAHTVIDFGSGIGADSMAFAGLGLNTTAIEMNEEAAAAATINLMPFPEAKVIMANGFEIDLDELGADSIWIDPARRKDGKRIKNPEEWYPSLSDAIKLARNFPSAGIKIAPGIDYSALPSDAMVEWISEKGSLLEAVIWLGRAAPTPGRSALVIDDDGAHRWDCSVADPRLPSVDVLPEDLGTFIFEPDPAIIRSGGIHSLCEQFDIAPVSHGIAYLTGNEPIDSPFLQQFIVSDVYPIEAKPIRRVLAELGVGAVEIKKRGTNLEPETFRKKLKLNTSRSGAATLIATPLLGRHRMILAERV